MSKLRGACNVIREQSYKRNGRGATKMKRLLLVEDQTLFREGLALLLEWGTGLPIVQAGSLAEARRSLSEAKDRTACVIVDLDLPDGDGTELLGQLRGLPVLALTGARNPKCYTQALEAGADEVLPVAGSAERIVGVVRRLVEG
jgi:DNA-binding NarL/FixJ family response regulator